MWTDRYIGIPYVEGGRSMAGFDCLGLFITLYKDRFNVALPDPRCSPVEAVRGRIFDREKLKWHPVKSAQEGDALVFRCAGRPLHVGFALNTKVMLHTEASAHSSCIERFQAPRWAGRLEGIYRFAGYSD